MEATSALGYFGVVVVLHSELYSGQRSAVSNGGHKVCSSGYCPGFPACADLGFHSSLEIPSPLMVHSFRLIQSGSPHSCVSVRRLSYRDITQSDPPSWSRTPTHTPPSLRGYRAKSWASVEVSMRCMQPTSKDYCDCWYHADDAA